MLVSGLLACAMAPAADSGRAALEAAIHRWTQAVNARDVATLAATMTEDVELSSDSTTVTGRDASIRALGEGMTGGKLVATTREIAIVDGVAWHVVGLARRQKNGDVLAQGQALEIWQRVEGQWRLHRRMVADARTPDVSLTRPPPDEPVLDRPEK